MTEVPRVRVWVADLDGECPTAMYDGRDRLELGIDFSYPPEQIADALTDLFQEAVDSGRWARHGTGAHELTADGTDQRVAPHPESDPHH